MAMARKYVTEMNEKKKTNIFINEYFQNEIHKFAHQIQNVWTEKCKRIASHMNCGNAPTSHARWYQFLSFDNRKKS